MLAQVSASVIRGEPAHERGDAILCSAHQRPTDSVVSVGLHSRPFTPEGSSFVGVHTPMISDGLRCSETLSSRSAATRRAPGPSSLDTLLAVITSTHAIIYADDADQARAFFRDVLDLPNVDAHDGWLIFKLPPAELGIHPAGQPGLMHGRHELVLMCDDIQRTVAELRNKGVEFTTPIEDQGFGLVTMLRIPGGGSLGLYEPKHPTGYDL